MAKADKTAAETQTATEKPAPAPKDERNGVTRPAGGVTRLVWEIADEISAKKGAPAERKEVTEIAEAQSINIGTIHTQFGRWRKYYGLVTPKEERAKLQAEAKAEREAKKAEEKAAKEAEKAAKAEEKAKAKAEKEAAAAAKAQAKADADAAKAAAAQSEPTDE
ncbi:MAG: hypothetical protein M0P09_01445 [Acholeplasmataceae bacterium]|nr:hypothetical protein [Acholeplasmataceae bacterium]